MTGDMLEKDVKKYIGTGCQKIWQTRILEDTPERMLIDMSEHISDKNGKKYIRNMSEKIIKIYVRRINKQEC